MNSPLARRRQEHDGEEGLEARIHALMGGLASYERTFEELLRTQRVSELNVQQQIVDLRQRVNDLERINDEQRRMILMLLSGPRAEPAAAPEPAGDRAPVRVERDFAYADADLRDARTRRTTSGAGRPERPQSDGLGLKAH